MSPNRKRKKEEESTRTRDHGTRVETAIAIAGGKHSHPGGFDNFMKTLRIKKVKDCNFQLNGSLYTTDFVLWGDIVVLSLRSVRIEIGGHCCIGSVQSVEC